PCATVCIDARPLPRRCLPPPALPGPSRPVRRPHGPAYGRRGPAEVERAEYRDRCVYGATKTLRAVRPSRFRPRPDTSGSGVRHDRSIVLLSSRNERLVNECSAHIVLDDRYGG